MSLEDVVNVSIDRETAVVEQESFDVIALLSQEVNSHNKVEYVSSPAEAALNLWGGVNSLTYKAVQQIFSQTPRCKKVALLQVRSSPYLHFDSGTFTAGSFSAVINGVKVTSGGYNSNKNDTIAQFCTNVAAALPGLNCGVSSSTAIAFTPGLYFGPLSIKDVDTSGITGTMAMKEGMSAQVVFSGTLTSGSIVTVLNEVTVTTNFVTSVEATLTAHAAAIKTALTAAIVPICAYSSGSILMLLTPGIRPVFSSITITKGGSDTLAVQEINLSTRNADYSEIELLTRAREESDSWYGLGYIVGDTTRASSITKIKSIADWAEANNKIFVIDNRDANSINQTVSADTTSLAYYIKSKSYARSFAPYNQYADGTVDSPEYLGLALLGKMFPKTPGSWTGEFKTLKGITGRVYTSTQKANAKAKNVGLYTIIGGRNVYTNAKVAEGEWLDTIVFCDWMNSLIKTNVFAPFINTDKIPFDDDGIGMLGSKVSMSLDAGIRSSGFTDHAVSEDGAVTGGYVVMLPKASEISPNEKNQRLISSTNPIRFIGYLAGAIHAVTIQGKVTV